MIRARWILAGAAVIALAGCSAVRPAPVVQSQALKMPPGTLQKVAVVPFSYKDTLLKYSGEGGANPQTAADLVTRFLTDAMTKRGIEVIPASDFATAFNARGLKAVDLNPRTAAQLAAQEFGATAILIGEVSRYRERGGEKYGATSSASVAFNATIYTAPVVQRVWSSQFDETQRALSENIVNARRYPGGGTRWLTAAELAQWGADSMVANLPSQY